jgi:hypothetical protein
LRPDPRQLRENQIVELAFRDQRNMVIPTHMAIEPQAQTGSEMTGFHVFEGHRDGMALNEVS